MNNSSSWNCFSWNRDRKCQVTGDRSSPRKHQERREEIPDEQFANLLGGEFQADLSCSDIPCFRLFHLNDNGTSGSPWVIEQLFLITIPSIINTKYSTLNMFNQYNCNHKTDLFKLRNTSGL